MESVDNNLQKLTEASVLVVGDVMLDQYWMGDVIRISPEAPVPIVAVDTTQERIGGAGNVAQNITSLGGKATLLGVIGDDAAGRSVSRIAEKAGIKTCLEAQSNTKTTIKLRVISRNQQLLRADFENRPSGKVLEQVHARYAQLVAQHDVIVFSDYGKGGLEGIEALIKMARASEKLVMVDPKNSDYSRYSGATMITPNLNEFESVVGKVANDKELHAKAASLVRKYDLKNILVTLSDKGMVLIDRDATPIHITSRSREVYDVSGAGDTVIAVMAMAMATGIPEAAALELANSAAGVVISKLGTATVTPDKLRAAILKDYQT